MAEVQVTNKPENEIFNQVFDATTALPSLRVNVVAGTLSNGGTVVATQPTHDNLNCNANIQVGDVDVSNGNPVPVTVQQQPISVNLAQQLDETNDKVQASLKVSATNIGLDTYFNAALAATAVAVKTSAANLYGWDFMSLAAAANIFVQFFDLAVASVTLGTTTPRNSVGIPNGQGKVLVPVTPITYVNAITVACTSTATGAGAPGGNCVANIFLK